MSKDKKAMWVQKYRPASLLDKSYIYNDENLKRFVLSTLKSGELPHLLFHGSAGTGKTTLATILIEDLEIDPIDVLKINASDERSIDDMRDKVKMFVGTYSMGKYKVVLLDECLDENTLVAVIRAGEVQHIQIKDLNDENDLVKSFNLESSQVEWRSFKLFDKGSKEVVEIEFENNQKIICTMDHKWYVYDENNNIIVVKTSELHKYNYILTDRKNE